MVYEFSTQRTGHSGKARLECVTKGSFAAGEVLDEMSLRQAHEALQRQDDCCKESRKANHTYLRFMKGNLNNFSSFSRPQLLWNRLPGAFFRVSQQGRPASASCRGLSCPALAKGNSLLLGEILKKSILNQIPSMFFSFQTVAYLIQHEYCSSNT